MKGVIHVGAHLGEEVPRYIAEGRSPIILFEPQSLEWDVPEGVTLVKAALSDYDGLLRLRVPHHLHDFRKKDTMSTSGLSLNYKNAIDIGWTPTFFSMSRAPVLRFDSWADKNYIPGSCKTLNIDAQGMELQVLEGFGGYISEFDDMTIECSSPALYDGGAPAETVIAFLVANGFEAMSPILRHGDIKFRRRG